jgi:hypothetical protein
MTTAQPAVLRVRLIGPPGVGKSALGAALLEVPHASDEEIARLQIEEGEPAPAAGLDDVIICVQRGPPARDAALEIERWRPRGARLLLALHAADLPGAHEQDLGTWTALVGEGAVVSTAAPPGAAPSGVEALRALLMAEALRVLDLPVERARRAKRPLAAAIIGGAALASAAEGLLPGAAGLVLLTQAGALGALHYLYTGRVLGRAQALALIPTFAGEAAGGGAFLLVKSFLPPTGIADAIAAFVAASLTIGVLGAVAYVLDKGWSLEEKEKLKLAFRRLSARTRKERASIVAERKHWKDSSYWTELVRRIIFD